jgi:hypothetical protein
MRATITGPRQISIPLNVELEAKPIVVVVSRGGEIRWQKGQLGRRTAGRDLFGGVQKKENREVMPDIQKKERSGGSNSEASPEIEIETIERTAKDLHRAPNPRQNWISMR